MRRVAVLALLLPLLTLVLAGPATAGVSCHQINATAAGQTAPPQAGDPPGLTRVVGQIRGGGLLQGTIEAVFQDTGSTPTGVTYTGVITFTTNRGTLTVEVDGTLDLDLATGEFEASGPVVEATGKLDGATGTLTFAGVVNLLDGSFTETVSGEICVDLGGNGKK